MITAKELAQELDGSAYPLDISKSLQEQALAAGLVVVYGQSDDLMEFRGAIDGAVGCYGGITVHLNADGLIHNKCGDECPYFPVLLANASPIEALWCDGSGFSWTYKTSIPHQTFLITDDDEPYCRGIVFGLGDAVPQEPR